MSKILEFIIKIKDLATGPVAKFGEQTTKVFSKLEADEKRLMQTNRLYGKSFDNLGSTIDRLKNKSRGIEIVSSKDIANVRALNSEVKRLESLQSKIGSMNGSKLKTWGKDAMNQMPGSGLLSNPLVAGGAAITALMSAGMNQEKHRVAFQTLSKGKDAGNALMGNLQSYAGVSPYRQDDVFSAGTVMKGFGMGDGETVTMMKMLGDVAMGSGEKLKELALVMGKVNTTGYLQGDELNSLIEKGFNPLAIIAEKTGKKYSDLKKAMEDGAITSNMVTGALQSATGAGGTFYQMSEKMSKTFGGKLSTFLDNFSITLAKLGEVIMPIASIALDAINTGLQFIVDNGEIIVGALLAIGAAWVYMNIGQIGYSIGMLVAKVWSLNVALLANPMVWVIAGIMALVAVIIYLKNHFGTLGNAWTHLKDIFMSVWQIIQTGFKMYVDSIVTTVEYMFYKVVAFFDRMIESAKSTGKAIGMAMSGDFSGAGAEWNKNSTSKYDTEANNILKQGIANQVDGINKITQLGSKIKTTWNDVPAKSKSDANASKSPYSMSGLGAGGGSSAKTKDISDSITGGGAKNIYITLGKFQDQLNIHTMTVKEGVNEMEQMIENSLLRILNSANTIRN